MTPFHHLFPSIDAAAIAAELDRETARRARFYARKVDEGAMTPADRDHQLALCAAWREDLDRMTDPACVTAGCGGAPPAHSLPWGTRRAGLAREIALRERIYPRGIAEGKLTEQTATHQLDCLRALAARYDGGWDWLASNGRPPRLADRHTPEGAAALAEFDAHAAVILAARAAPAHQQELAL